jgi:hypothetical protein
MKTLMLSVSVFFAIAGFLIATPTVSAQTDVIHIQTRTQLAANLLNPCNGEMVATEAEQFENITLRINNNGIHFHVTTNLHGVGTGLTTGAKYRLNAVSTAHNNDVGASNQTLTQDFVFNGQGSVPNFVVHLTEHFTINANGDLVVDFRKVDTKCH